MDSLRHRAKGPVVVLSRLAYHQRTRTTLPPASTWIIIGNVQFLSLSLSPPPSVSFSVFLTRSLCRPLLSVSISLARSLSFAPCFLLHLARSASRFLSLGLFLRIREPFSMTRCVDRICVFFFPSPLSPPRHLEFFRFRRRRDLRSLTGRSRYMCISSRPSREFLVYLASRDPRLPSLSQPPFVPVAASLPVAPFPASVHLTRGLHHNTARD